MKSARVVLDPDFTVAPVSPRVFGSFVEHMGRCVYGGIYEPGHPAADAEGLRTDVLALTRELGVSTVRYPGGNFVSNYRWEDGVGPRSHRPVRRDLAWRTIETNAFGVDEFVAWARLADVEPMLAVNLGTRGVADAVDLLEYCNLPVGTQMSDLRAANGSTDPHDVLLWCLGNEMDGPWQIGSKTAEEYGRVAAETGKAMKRMDPRIQLVACGSSNAEMPTFGTWEATVLEHCYDTVDFVSLHAYYEQKGDDLASFLSSGASMDRFIEGVVATADHVRAVKHADRRIMLSFDEWNAWTQNDFGGEDSLSWERAPSLIEEDFNAADAVVVGGLLVSLLKHADRVTMACQAQLANVIAPIRTSPGSRAWKQTIFHPFALIAANARGVVLAARVDAPVATTAEHGEVDLLDVVATVDEATGATAIFLVNRSPQDPLEVQIDTRTCPRSEEVAVTTLRAHGGDLSHVRAGRDAPAPVTSRLHVSANDRLTLELPPASWTMATMATGVRQG